MLSSLHVRRKHEASCCLGQPALNIVGVACVKRPRDMRSYACSTAGASRPCTHSATRISMCCGRSRAPPSSPSR